MRQFWLTTSTDIKQFWELLVNDMFIALNSDISTSSILVYFDAVRRNVNKMELRNTLIKTHI